MQSNEPLGRLANLKEAKMQNYICTTCGHQFAESKEPPPYCPICEDDRQYVNPAGQTWTTLDELARGHRNLVKSLETGLTGIGTEPKFAIGQRALGLCQLD